MGSTPHFRSSPLGKMPPPLQLKIVTLALETLSNNARDVVASLVSDFLVADVSLSKAIEWSPPGSVSLLEFVWTRGLRDAESSRWTVAKLLHSDKNYYKWEFSLALVQAIRRADLGLIQWLLQHFTGCPVEKDVVEAAARGGHLWVLQLLEADQSHDGIQWGDNCLTEAAKGGHWEFVHWLHQRVGTPPHEDFRLTKNVAEYAFQQFNVEQLKWAMGHGFELSQFSRPEECGDSERGNCWETVRYLLAEGHESTPYLVEGALVLTVKFEDLEFMQWLLNGYVTGNEEEDINDRRASEKRLTSILGAAGQNGNTSALQVLLTHFTELHLPHDPSKAMFEAAKHGKLDTVRWLVERYSDNADVDLFRGLSNQVNANTTNPFTAMDIAASHGHLEILRYLHEVDASQRNKRKRDERDSYPNRDHCRRCTATAMNVAASNGYLEVIKWLHANRNEGCTAFAMNGAAANGHLEVVEWLHLNRTEGCTSAAMNSAASRYYRLSLCCGNRDKPRQFYEPNSFVKNQLSVIQWLHANREEGCTAKAMDGAAANGNLEMVKWLHENTTGGCTQRAMDCAAGGGYLNVVKWLHENRSEGCTTLAIDYAAEGGHLEVLKYLHENFSEGCTKRALDVAVHGDLEVLTWLLANSPEERGSKAMSKIAHGHLEVVQWLLDHCEGLDIASAMERAIVCREPEIVCYLDAQRTDRSITVNEMRARLRNSSPFSLA